MGPTTIVAILFDDEDEHVFTAGQVVTGQVHIRTKETIEMSGVRLKLTGKAKVSWTEGSGDSRKTYRGYQDCLKLEIAVIGSRSDDSELYLKPGSYNFPFNFVLPADIPASFGGKYGYIHYCAKAVIDGQMAIDTAEVVFTVVRLLDLNKEPPQLREPVVVQNEYPVTGCCCVGGFNEITFSVNRGMFVPGETILVQGQIVNRTESDIQYSIVAFHQTIEFCAIGSEGNIKRKRNAFKTLAEHRRPSLQYGETDSWNDLSFVVPKDIPLSRLDGCMIINITYSIMVIPVLDDCCTTYSSAEANVVIGNIPLQDYFQPPPPVITSQPLPYELAVGYSQTGKTFMDFETKESIL